MCEQAPSDVLLRRREKACVKSGLRSAARRQGTMRSITAAPCSTFLTVAHQSLASIRITLRYHRHPHSDHHVTDHWGLRSAFPACLVARQAMPQAVFHQEHCPRLSRLVAFHMEALGSLLRTTNVRSQKACRQGGSSQRIACPTLGMVACLIICKGSTSVNAAQRSRRNLIQKRSLGKSVPDGQLLDLTRGHLQYDSARHGISQGRPVRWTWHALARVLT